MYRPLTFKQVRGKMVSKLHGVSGACGLNTAPVKNWPIQLHNSSQVIHSHCINQSSWAQNIRIWTSFF